MMAAKDVGDGAAIGNDVALEAPVVAQMLFEQEGVRAGGLTVQRVVRAHHGFGFAFDDRGAKRGKVRVFHVVARSGDVNGVARRFRSAVHGEVLRRRDGLEIFRIGALQAR